MATRDDVNMLNGLFWEDFYAAHCAQPFYKNYVTDRLIVWEPCMPPLFVPVESLPAGGATAWVA